jgi:hypothetical protein
VPLEGVVHALRNIHAALVPGGVLVDTQPLSPRPAVEGDAGPLGTLDLTEWARMLGEIEARVQETVAAGLFAIESESWLVVTDEFDDGAELVATARDWAGTRIEPELERRAAGARGPVRVHQDVRMRLLRARAGR